VAFSPGGTQVVSGSGDKTVRLWDAVTGAALQTIHGHSAMVNSVAFSPDGKKIASGSDDETVRLWDAVMGAALQTLYGHSAWVLSVAFSPDGKKIASGSRDKSAALGRRDGSGAADARGPLRLGQLSGLLARRQKYQAYSIYIK
jgi:WD40 repeat protein